MSSHRERAQDQATSGQVEDTTEKEQLGRAEVVVSQKRQERRVL